MQLRLSILMIMALMSFSLIAQAGKQEGLSFSNKDWDLACDNTRTCRAAGYHLTRMKKTRKYQDQDLPFYGLKIALFVCIIVTMLKLYS